MQEAMADLKQRYQEIADLTGAAALLRWDQSTYMPRGGAAARGSQLALLQRLIQERQSDPTLGHLLDSLQAYGESLPADHDDAALLRVARRNFERENKVPTEYIARRTAHIADAFSTWAQARPNNDFGAVQANLQKTLELSLEYTTFFPGYERIMDPFVSLRDYGLTTNKVSEIFATLRAHLVPMVRKIAAQAPTDNSCLYGDYPGEKQLAYVRGVIKRFGYDYGRGRDDRTHHPFATKFALGDVRITTRVDDRHLGDGLFATMHEAGHGMYEQGSAPEIEGTPLAGGTSGGVHESQSRLWENLVGRGRNFWEHEYANLQAAFPGQLDDVPLDTFYRAINKVEPSLIRVRADELTYNLHIMLRFELELAMLEGDLAIADLPDAWNAAYESYLGITPPDFKDGVMQDVHWYGYVIGGMFHSYTIGNVLSGQFFAAAKRAEPNIGAEISAGKYDTLFNWLNQNIYRYGKKYTPSELLIKTTGSDIDTAPYLAYLDEKYGALYDLS